ncbi:non-ribosomal peptide synthase/polyketide synthase [Paenibacillus sp. FSL R7-0652]|uniref:non-ribosomal peptide synthetase n=1 Tax=Paenibacillus sp. FSL R7-0652 TaxID=2921687 RepID=UPI00315B1B18
MENIKDIYQLTPLQEGMLYHRILEEKSDAYFVQMTLEVRGSLDIFRFQECFNTVIQKHDVLRTVFLYDTVKVPIQVVYDKIQNQILHEDIMHLSEEDQLRKIEFLKSNDREIGFSLNEGPLIRMSIIKLTEEYHVVVISFHHIIMDGWSLGIVIQEMMRIYFNDISTSQVINPPTSYSSYIKWLNKQDTEMALDYWSKMLGDYDHRIRIMDRQLDEVSEEHDYKSKNFTLDTLLTKKLVEFSVNNQVTVNTIIQVIWGILLQRYNNVTDVVYGSVISGRPAEILGIESMVGLFINTIPVRIRDAESLSFNEYVKNVQLEAFSSEKFSYVPLYKIQTNTKLKNKLFNHIVVFENYPINKGIASISEEIDIQVTEFSEHNNYNLSVIIHQEDTLNFKFTYNSKVISENDIVTICKHLKETILTVLKDPTIKLSDINIVPNEEKAQIAGFNATEAAYPKEKTIHQLFEEQVERTPENIAVVYKGEELTYRELNERANQLARNLRARGVGPESIVGLMVERSLEMIVGIMGVLKAGGAYLPLDPTYPQERITYMLEDSGTALILTQRHVADRVAFQGDMLYLEDQKIYSGPGDDLAGVSSPQNLAYVIYTSGTTGRPKGVLTTHRNVVRLLVSDNSLFDFNSNDVWTLFHSYCFDFSVWEMYGALVFGGTLIVVPHAVVKNPTLFMELLETHQVTILNQTPSYFKQLANEILTNNSERLAIRKIIFGGEALNPSSLRIWNARYPNIQLINMYGITEITVHATYKEITVLEIGEACSNIGKPIPTLGAFILDRNGHMSPLGVAGELYISGDGLARGYLNQPELTAERFVPNPFEPGERMYRTGDLARWLPDGNVEYLGRIDDQVKIRGYRIELGEIETQLAKHEHVIEAAVVAREDLQGQSYLCGYVVANGDLTVASLRQYLGQGLPDYMIPAHFVQLDQLPLTPNGKLDRKALPEPNGTMESGRVYVAPRSETEEQLAALWKSVLGVEKIGVQDSFFELGGHSLNAMIVVSRVNREFAVDIPLREMFQYPTIEELAVRIEQAEQGAYALIEPVEERKYYPVSASQKRQYVLHQLGGAQTVYNMPVSLVLKGACDLAQLERIFRTLVGRHESLRTSFGMVDGEIVQYVHPEVDFAMAYEEAEESAADTVAAEFVRPFDLEQAPLFRAKLVKLGEEHHLLLLDMPHIVSDGVSMGILADEFARLYAGEALSELRVQYKDYAVWQHARTASEEMNRQQAYWTETLSGELPVLALSTDRARPAVQSYEGSRMSFQVSEEITEGLKKLALETGSTLYMVLLAAYNTLLHRYTGQEDIVVGTPIAGRSHADLEPVVGMFVNTLAMRNQPRGEKSFTEFLAEVKETTLGAYGNQDYPFDRLVEEVAPRRDMSRNPLFDTMFVLQNMEQRTIELEDLEIQVNPGQGHVSKMDITVTAWETEGSLQCEIEYATQLYDRETIERMSGHWQQLLRSLIEAPHLQLSEVEVVTESEKAQIAGFNATEAAYPKEKTIHQLFEEQVERTPENIAVVYEGEELTYRELNERANQLARNLRARGVGPESIVGLMVERSLEMIVGIMGVLKAGGAYLPLDPTYPQERITYMLEDSGTALILTQRHVADRVAFQGDMLYLEDQKIYSGPGDDLAGVSSPQNLAYVIYTSGTTGRPKGVLTTHRNVVRLLVSDNSLFDFNSNDVWTLFHSYCFDFSVWEMYGALVFGGTLIVVPHAVVKNPTLFMELLETHQVTILNQTPSYFKQLANEILTNNSERLAIRKIIFGGEALNPSSLRIWNARYPNIQLINMYGITEITVHATYKEITVLEIGEACSNIGKPIPTLGAFILDRNGHMSPLGVAGELYISGDGLARGYLNQPELTAERFVPNPFKPGERMYRTGDLARWLPDGNVEYLGRIDDQVKIRGYRIELGEIETQLAKHEHVIEAAVVAREDLQGQSYLCGYVVANGDLTVASLRQYLGQGLPDYMIPAHFVQLDQLPLTPNGKLDRKALPEPNGTMESGRVYVAPRSETEEQLAALWKSVLGVEKIGVQDSFFELGGHSLNAMIVVSRVNREFAVDIPLREMFQYPTIEELAVRIEQAEQGAYALIEPVEERKYYPVSASQKRQYVLHQLGGAQTVYNMPVSLVLKGACDLAQLERIFRTLVGRHESLRTSFGMVDGEIVQYVHPEVDFAMAYEEAEESAADTVAAEFVRPFDLEQAPLFRAKLVKLGEEHHLLLLDMPHIVSDGVSMGILADEFARLYAGEALSELRVQYKDYAVWQHARTASEEMNRQQAYWTETLSGELPVLALSTDRARPAVQSYEGSRMSFQVSEEITEGLKKLALETGSTLYMVLLAAYNTLLHRYTGQEDIVVGTPIAGRSHADLEPVVGMFVNTLAMRNQPRGEKSFTEFLAEVKETTLGAYGNQDYPFDRLVEEVAPRRDMSRNPLFDTMFVLQNMEQRTIELEDLEIQVNPGQGHVSKMDITVTAWETEGSLQCEIEYATQLYDRETIKRMSGHWQQLLRSLIEAPHLQLSEVEVVTESEKAQIAGFNATEAAYPKEKTIHQLFEEQVERTPENIAVVYEGEELTYRELNERANQLAHHLSTLGVCTGDSVGICLERSVELIISELAIIKSGAMFIPLDPELPKGRLSHMIEQSKIQIVVTKVFWKRSVFQGEVTTICLDSQSVIKILEQENRANPVNCINVNERIYTIFTSGSTGVPKGASVYHNSFVNLVNWYVNEFKIVNSDIFLIVTSPAFDATQKNIFAPLIKGGTIVLLPAGPFDSFTVVDLVEKYKVSVINCTPTMLYSIVGNASKNQLTSLNWLFIGGEPLKVDGLKRTLELTNKTQIVNIYGPTECTDIVLYQRIRENSLLEDKSVPIGKPIYNTRIYIVDKSNGLAPLGIEGEICIAGSSLGAGYINNEDQTLTRFVPNPFEPGERMYRTGDLARWLPDGNVEYLGRIDDQVKIRGYRIELGEIETQLAKHEHVIEAAVVAREDLQGQSYLCGYVVANGDLTVASLRQYLGQGLPDYMIPAHFVQLDQLPLTPNGKLDRKALPEPNGTMESGRVYVAPRSETEEQLAALWKSVLGVEKIGVQDSFFELGGHSLNAMIVVSRVNREFAVDIPLREMFQYPTIEELAVRIEQAEQGAYALIEPVVERKYYPVSASQKRQYVLHQLGGAQTVYNMPVSLVLKGACDLAQLERIFRTLVGRHESLRTSFGMVDGEIVQYVHPEVDFAMAYEEAEESAADTVAAEFVRPFDLEQAPLFRAKLVKLGEEHHLLLLDMPHIVSDGVSMGILADEFARLYAGEALSELRVQYKDYAVWQHARTASEEMNRQQAYWTETLSGELPVLALSTDRARPAVQSYEGSRMSFQVSEEITEGLKKLALETGSTLYMVLLAAYNTLLHRYTGQEDIVVGTPIAGRSHADLEPVVGMFVNTLAMRNQPRGEKSFTEFLAEVKETTLGAYGNQDYPFDRLVEEVAPRRDMSRNPLFDTMFVLQNMEQRTIELEDLEIQVNPGQGHVSKMDITVTAWETKGSLQCEIEYATQLYDRETIKRMSGHWQQLLRSLIEAPHLQLSEVEVVTESEKAQIAGFNATEAAYPKEKMIHQLFEEQVERTPENIAVVYEGEELTYRELNERANQLARNLRARGVGPESIVGLMVERSLEMIVGIMGVLKAGGAYLPLDPTYPQERITYMLEDSGTALILTQRHVADRVAFQGAMLYLEDQEIYSGPGDNLAGVSSPQNLAYVIYTSGSTGKPKGVLIEQRNLVNYVWWAKGIYCENNQMNFPLYSTISFDATVTSLFTPLLIGSKLIVFGNSNGATLLQDVLRNDEVEILKLTPSHMRLILNEQIKSQTLKKLIIGGELLEQTLVNTVVQNGFEIEIFNSYGPTEATVNCMSYTCNTSGNIFKSVPIGSPGDNTRIYILDSSQNLQPLGVAGELYISGDGLARGYLNQPELTAERFVPNPFEPGERMYRTGDLARWLPDGNVEYLGRIDDQVKIRGYRIELGEIETQLAKHEHVIEAAVVAREDLQGQSYLCGYVVANGDLTVASLRQYLGQGLPDYMIPAHFVQLDQLPLTPNGKLDRKALPEPNGTMESGRVYVAPRSETEEQLAALWKSVLGVEKIGVQDSFFELGGHSLNAMIVVSRVNREFAVDIPLREMFQYPTIEELAVRIEQAEQGAYALIEPVVERKYYPVSASQKRQYVLHQLGGAQTVYNMPVSLVLKGACDLAQLERIFRTLVGRHESLRTSFGMVDGEIVQYVHPEVDFAMAYEEAEESAADTVAAEFVRPFDLEQAPLFRAKLVKLGEEHHLLLLDMPHIVSDGVSMGILADEFARLYAGEALSELRVQYKDYAVWQHARTASEEMNRQQAYWTETLSGELPVLALSTDRARPAVQSYEGSRMSFQVSEEITEGLKKLALETGSTLYMVLLAAYNTLLHRYTGQEDIVVGTPIAGRSHADLEPVVGMFVNTLAMRNQPRGEKSFTEFLAEVKETTLGAYGNQDYPFDRLVEEVAPRRDMSRNPLFDTMFVLQNMEQRTIELEDLEIQVNPGQGHVSKMDITVTAWETEGSLQCEIEYATQLYDRETIERMSGHWQQLLRSLIEAPHLQLSEVEVVTESEKAQIAGFNATEAAYPKEKTIHQLFEEQVERTPENIAVVYEGEELTYRELNERANQLARNLRARGVGPESIVGLMVERSLEMIVGIMGVLKAGGAYLPLDPTYPQERITYMLEDSGTALILTQRHVADRVAFQGAMLYLEDQEIYSGPGDNLAGVSSPQNLAYVIYTSGTTGKPKGVLVVNQGVVRLVKDTNYISIDEADTLLQASSISFDAATFEIWGALLNGAKLILVTTTISLDNLRENIVANNVSIMWLTSALFNLAVDYDIEMFSGVQTLLVGGEAVSPKHVMKLLDNTTSINLINGYGPTENTTFTCFYPITTLQKESVPIGKPVSNTKVYVLDKGMQPAPIGVVGELYTSGDGLARGYLNQPELTAKCFVPNPFEPGERMYRTGDLARWLPDGNVEYLGRIDDQVKIRGYRIELGEIEARLVNHEQVIEAVVVARENQLGLKSLCGYVVTKGTLLMEEIRQYLSRQLPEYMIPAHFVELDYLPLTSNGKIDRRALPEPNGKIQTTGRTYVAPRNEIEKMLTKIWENVLMVERIGIEDSFFELGGDSIKAIQVSAELHKFEFKVSIKDIFTFPTIFELSPYLEQVSRRIYQGVVEGEALLTPIQHWFFNQSFSEINHWNQSVVLFSEAGFSEKLVQKSFEKILAHHDALRMKYSFERGEYKQYNRGLDEGIGFTLQTEKINDRNIGSRIIELGKTLHKSIDLEHGPLVKLGLFKTVLGDHLMIVIHHLVIDGVSWRILLEDFSTIYHQLKSNKEPVLPMKTDSYKEWSEKLNEYAKSNNLLSEIPYWAEIEKLSRLRPLSKDHTGSESSAPINEVISVMLSKEKTNTLLTRVSKAYNTEIDDILLTALALSIKSWTRQNRVCVELEGHGREKFNEDTNVSRTIGWFTSKYPIILDVQSEEIGQQIKTVKEMLRKVPNKGVGYEILKYLTPRERNVDLNFETLPEISFNYLGQFNGSNEDNGFIKLSPYSGGENISNQSKRTFPLAITGIVNNQQLTLSVSYNTNEFLTENIERLLNHYQDQLIKVIDHCISMEKTILTPSDVTLNDVTFEELDDIYKALSSKKKKR